MTTGVKSKRSTLDYILDKFNLSPDEKTSLPIEIPNFGRKQLPALFNELGYKVGVEVGIYKGEYSQLLCKGIPRLTLHGIDPYLAYGEFSEQQLLDEAQKEAKDRLALYENHHFIEKTSVEAASGFADNSLDFVYIDGNHNYENVIADLTAWSEKVRPGGIIAGHDYIKYQGKYYQVVAALKDYTQANSISPWFVLGAEAKIPGMIRDSYRSWMWVKTNLTAGSMLGKWDSWYEGVNSVGAFRYGETVTYQLAADFLADMAEVEDWGCGTGGFKKHYSGKYSGIDGSANPFVDKLVDLRTYRSDVDGIVMRHVLEHNYDWEKVLAGAVSSFRKRFCLILFTPFMATTREIAHNKKHGVDVPDIAFKRDDIERFFEGLKWRLQDNIKTRTGYRAEHIYYVEK